MKTLTENQEKLIEQIKNEFLTMNGTEEPTSFAEVLLNDIAQTRKEFDEIALKGHALFNELKAQYDKNVAYLKAECNKLGIEVHDDRDIIKYSPDSGYCSGSIKITHPKAGDDWFFIYVKVFLKYHSKNGLKVYEPTADVFYGFTSDSSYMREFNSFINTDKFKSYITHLYHKINR
jgi:hypothetical protein